MADPPAMGSARAVRARALDGIEFSISAWLNRKNSLIATLKVEARRVRPGLHDAG